MLELGTVPFLLLMLVLPMFAHVDHGFDLGHHAAGSGSGTPAGADGFVPGGMHGVPGDAASLGGGTLAGYAAGHAGSGAPIVPHADWGHPVPSGHSDPGGSPQDGGWHPPTATPLGHGQTGDVQPTVTNVHVDPVTGVAHGTSGPPGTRVVPNGSTEH